MPPCMLFVLTAVIDQLCLPLHSRLTLHLASKDRSTSRRDIAYKHVKVATRTSNRIQARPYNARAAIAYTGLPMRHAALDSCPASCPAA